METSQNNRPSLTLRQLPVGWVFPSTKLMLSRSVISRYLEAIDDQVSFLTSGLVPPLILAACANTALSKSFLAPPGTIHVSQDFEFLQTVAIEDTVLCCGRVAQKLERGKMNLIVLEVIITNQNGEKILTGVATLTLPD
jgi:hypothetical protein